MSMNDTKTSLFGLVLLSASIIAMSSLTKSRTVAASLINKEYNDILSILFSQQPNVTSATRHSLNSTKTDIDNERFQLRKSFFQSLYNDSFKHKHVKVIHIAGSKGKGSTTEFIAAALRQQGYSVGVFTSPHLHTARERIKIGKSIIPKETFLRISKEVITLMETYDWKVFFDYFLAISIKYFAEQSVDYIIFEAGLGGRYDSTNFIDSPEVSIITSISLDHQAILGDTIEEIAWQKAGIIKAKCPIFTSQTQCDSVLQVFREYSNQVNATLYEIPISNDIGIDKKVSSPKKSVSDYLSQDQLKYSVQIENACLALSVINHLQINPIGMKNFYWPCRMEEFKTNGVTFVLDGCHNGDSVRQFLSGMHKEYPDHAVIVLFGAGKEKCVNDMLSIVMDLADSVIMVQSKHFKSTSEVELCSMVNADVCKKHLFANIKPEEYTPMGTINTRMKWILNESIKKDSSVFHSIALSNGHKKYVIAVCGSLFVTSEAREWLYNYNPTLFTSNDWVTERDTL